MKNTLQVLILSLLCVVCFSTVSLAGPSDPNDSGVPIDGGASLLVGAAVVYGIKKYKDRKKEEQPIK
jgi:hypothetical protein